MSTKQALSWSQLANAEELKRLLMSHKPAQGVAPIISFLPTCGISLLLDSCGNPVAAPLPIPRGLSGYLELALGGHGGLWKKSFPTYALRPLALTSNNC